MDTMKADDLRRDGLWGLVPVPTAERPLSRSQKAFRTLLTTVESLRKALDAETEELDATLTFHASEIVPRLSRQSTLQKDLVRALAPYVNKSFFPVQKERLTFKEFMQDLLDEIASTEKGLADTDLHDIYNAVHGVGYGFAGVGLGG